MNDEFATAAEKRKTMTMHVLGKLGAAFFILHSSFFISCEYKDLCYDHNHYGDVTVRFDWQAVPQAQVGGMTVLFYQGAAAISGDDTRGEMTSDGDAIRYDYAGMAGGTARLLPGTYRATAYNYDTETILYRGVNAISSLEAYTRRSSIEEGTQLSRSGMPRATNTEDEPVILEPDPLFAATGDAFTLGLNDQRTVDMPAHQRYEEVTINIHHVPNLQYTSQFGGALSGLAPSMMMQTGVPGERRATQAFTATVVGDSTLSMQLRIFGHCPHAADGVLNPHLLTIYAILADGSKWYYTEDVTLQMHSSSVDPEHRHIELELDGLPVPKPIVNGSGFQPTIDGWQGVEIEVGM